MKLTTRCFIRYLGTLKCQLYLFPFIFLGMGGYGFDSPGQTNTKVLK